MNNLINNDNYKNLPCKSFEIIVFRFNLYKYNLFKKIYIPFLAFSSSFFFASAFASVCSIPNPFIVSACFSAPLLNAPGSDRAAMKSASRESVLESQSS